MEKFTVIIPTLDHCETLAHTLESCIVQQDEHFTILVSDNLSSDATRETVEHYQKLDRRVKLISPPRRLSMAAHYEFALSQVTEGFIMILGADDGLLPGAMARARSCLKQHPDALALHGSMNAIYFYPDFYRDEKAGRLWLRLTPRDEQRSAREQLDHVAHGEAGAYQLPQPYHVAWVHAKVLDQLALKTGRRIHSPTPDIYLAVAVASQLETYIHTCPPFGIYGVSVKSTGGSMVHAQGDRTIEREFLRTSELEFHPKIGYSRSVDMQTGECMLRAKELGLLPADFVIHWDRLIARGYAQFCYEPWDEEQRQLNIQQLREQSRNVGCTSMMDLADTFPDFRDWKANLPFSLDLPERPWEFVADTRALGITGIHEAARLAEELFLAAKEGTSLPSIVGASGDQLRSWGIQQMATDAAEFRRKIEQMQSRLDRSRMELTKAKKKLQQRKEASTRQHNKKGVKNMLTRWFKRDR